MSHGVLMTFRCSKCGVKLKAKAELQGKPFWCPKRKTEVVVPIAAEYAEPTVVHGVGNDDAQPGLPPPAPMRDSRVGRWDIFLTTFIAVVVANIRRVTRAHRLSAERSLKTFWRSFRNRTSRTTLPNAKAMVA
jgi:hypothetical protein